MSTNVTFCPYNKFHIVRKDRILHHILKCQEREKEKTTLCNLAKIEQDYPELLSYRRDAFVNKQYSVSCSKGSTGNLNNTVSPIEKVSYWLSYQTKPSGDDWDNDSEEDTLKSSMEALRMSNESLQKKDHPNKMQLNKKKTNQMSMQSNNSSTTQQRPIAKKSKGSGNIEANNKQKAKRKPGYLLQKTKHEGNAKTSSSYLEMDIIADIMRR